MTFGDFYQRIQNEAKLTTEESREFQKLATEEFLSRRNEIISD